MKECSEFKKSVVRIYSFVYRSLYDYKSATKQATGFVINLDKGLIVLNKHIADDVLIQEILVSFFDDARYIATLVYSDPEHDFAIIKVDTSVIPTEIQIMNFSNNMASDIDPVTILTYDREPEEGFVIDSRIARGHFGTQSFITDISTKLGDSGSPVINSNCEILGMQFSLDKANRSVSIHGSYIKEALVLIDQGIKPVRQSIGAILDYCKIEDLIRFLDLGSVIKEPHSSSGKMVCIRDVIDIDDMPKTLHVLDVVLKIDGHNITDLHQLHSLINRLTNTTNVEIIRNGLTVNAIVNPFDLVKYKISKALYINDAIIYNADIFTHITKGAEIGKPFISDVKEGGMFYDMRLSQIKQISSYKIESLDEFLFIVPEMVCKGQFPIYTLRFTPKIYFNDVSYFRHLIEVNYIEIQKSNVVAKLLEYDDESMSWNHYDLLDAEKSDYCDMSFIYN